VVLIIVSFSGCTDKPEEVQDEVNVYVYEQTGEEGDPQEQIREFYDMVDEQSGPPILVSLRKHAAEYDLDPEGNVIPDSVKIYDPDGNPVDRETALAMQDNIARDDAGNIITDAAQLDLQIEKIKENKYEIHNLRQEMQVEDGIWTVSHEMGNKYSGDTEFNDNIFIINDGLDDMCGGIVLDDNGTPHGVILIDEDTWDLYGGNFGTKARGENHPRGIDKEDCTHLGNGIYAYVVDLSETPKGSMTVRSHYPTMEGLDITDKNGGYAQFRFVKDTI
jgi:hypothetical protein